MVPLGLADDLLDRALDDGLDLLGVGPRVRDDQSRPPIGIVAPACSSILFSVL